MSTIRNVVEKRFAARIGVMIESRLIDYRHYYDWADELIAQFDAPPLWLIEIATIRHYPDAVAAINRFIYPASRDEVEDRSDELISCLFVRYRIRAISWATFLMESGNISDMNSCCSLDCEYFFLRLNKLEENEYSQVLEFQQVGEFERLRSESIRTIQEQYEVFVDYFRRWLSRGPKAN